MGRRWVILALVALAAFAAAFALAPRGDDDDDTRSDLDLEGLDALTVEARELVTLADQGSHVAHHAVYEQSGGDRLEVWTDGARLREETTPADGPRRLLLRTDDEDLVCLEEAASWSCEEATDEAEGVQTRIEQLVVDLIGVDVTVRDGTVAGAEVRCFEAGDGEELVEVCLTRVGILARLAAGSARLELVDLDDDVGDDHFDAPEQV
jgi:hypothetical protein